MLISVSVDELTGIAPLLVAELECRGHRTLLHGVLGEGEGEGEGERWAWAAEAVARDVAGGAAEQGIVCCWTGTGASIAANKVAGVRAALCGDGVTASGARKWNDANVLALSLRTTSQALLAEILDAWFAGEVSEEPEDLANIAHVAEIARECVDVAAQLAVRGGRAAVDFYIEAFAASEIYRVGGSDEHEAVVSQLRVGARTFWVADESPEHLNFSPDALGGATVKMLLVVEDPDAAVARALAAGASEVRATADEHGWRLGRIVDPFGHHWEIGRPLGEWPPGGNAG
jgi:RpiB/LacA/LacB family sugar-phosphate isomerase